MLFKPVQKVCLVLLVAIIVLLTGSENSRAIQVGGKVELESGLFYQDDVRANFAGQGELEFYLPETRKLDTRLVLRARLGEGSPEVGIKYLYLRYHLENGHFTLGRQPVSWSYGAIMNPLGFGFGIEGLAGESVTPEVNALRYFHSLGNGSSLQLVLGFPEGLTAQPLDRLAIGARVRAPLPGHDFGLVLTDRPLWTGSGPGEDNLFRAGFSYSGDLGPVGVYGAFGYYRLRSAEIDDLVGQVGVDYSWKVGPEYEEKDVYLQAEYLRFFKEELGPVLLMQVGEGNGFMPEANVQQAEPVDIQDMLVGNLSMEIDPFSQAGLALITETREWLLALIPYYQTDLGGGVELRLEGSFLRDPAGELSGGGRAVLNYYF